MKINIGKKLAAYTMAGVMFFLPGCGSQNSEHNADSSKSSIETVEDYYTLERFYNVQNGDTLTSIAEEVGTTPDKIAKDNGLENPDRIKEGLKLKLSYNVPACDLDYYTTQVSLQQIKNGEVDGLRYDNELGFIMVDLNVLGFSNETYKLLNPEEDDIDESDYELPEDYTVTLPVFRSPAEVATIKAYEREQEQEASVQYVKQH